MGNEQKNAAAALHSILRDFRDIGSASLEAGWKDLLGAAPGTPEFVRRHGEIVRLILDVSDRGMALPEEDPLRNQIDTYLPYWYSAVVHRGHWNTTSTPPHAVVEGNALNVLQLVGQMFEYRFADAATTASSDVIDRLKSGLAEWKSLVESGDLPDQLATQIGATVGHIEWLLDNAHLFGYQPVVREVQALVGTGVGAIAGRPTLGKKILKRIGTAIGGVLFFIEAASGAAADVDDFMDSMLGIHEKSQEIHQIFNGEQKAIEGPRKAIEGPRPEDVPNDEGADVYELRINENDSNSEAAAGE